MRQARQGRRKKMVNGHLPTLPTETGGRGPSTAIAECDCGAVFVAEYGRYGLIFRPQAAAADDDPSRRPCPNAERHRKALEEDLAKYA
jgi:hypothetical protein